MLIVGLVARFEGTVSGDEYEVLEWDIASNRQFRLCYGVRFQEKAGVIQ